MSDQETPAIEFPCEYPIKVLGRAVEEFELVVLAVFELHAPGFDRETVSIRPSRKGNFNSLNITIIANSREHLDALHKDLQATGLVQLVI